MELTDLQKKILLYLQKGLNIKEFPFKDLLTKINISATELIIEIKALLDDNIIRDISAILQAKQIGFHSALIAITVDEQYIEKVAKCINAHNGVSHNYLRDHTFNIWFTLTIPQEESFETVLSQFQSQCLIENYHVFHNEEEFKIKMVLPFDKDGNMDGSIQTENKNITSKELFYQPLSSKEIECLKLLQKQMPLSITPFLDLYDSNKLSISFDEFLKTANDLLDRKIIKRYSAVLRHRKAGYTSNAMTAWKTGGSETFNADIEQFRQNPHVSHLYRRTIKPGVWEYPIFAMVHGKDDSHLQSIITELEEKTGWHNRLVLKTLKEFKKERVRYFV